MAGQRDEQIRHQKDEPEGGLATADIVAMTMTSEMLCIGEGETGRGEGEGGRSPSLQTHTSAHNSCKKLKRKAETRREMREPKRKTQNNVGRKGE